MIFHILSHQYLNSQLETILSSVQIAAEDKRGEAVCSRYPQEWVMWGTKLDWVLIFTNDHLIMNILVLKWVFASADNIVTMVANR